jgi:hypothetical protein
MGSPAAFLRRNVLITSPAQEGQGRQGTALLGYKAPKKI